VRRSESFQSEYQRKLSDSAGVPPEEEPIPSSAAAAARSSAQLIRHSQPIRYSWSSRLRALRHRSLATHGTPHRAASLKCRQSLQTLERRLQTCPATHLQRPPIS